MPTPDWQQIKANWTLAPGVTYLNHGSFGPPSDEVRAERRRWIDQLDGQPMEMFVYKLESLWEEVTGPLAEWLGADRHDLVLIENATVAMNIVADSFPLRPGDEVLLTDHAYGAVKRIWQRACIRHGAKVETVELPFPPESDEHIVDTICTAATDATRLVVVSHMTSPTALMMPVQKICRRLRTRNVAVCIDGPHGPAQLPVDLAALDCDFYTASLHKWVSAPFGSGFLYVHPRFQDGIVPQDLSWGRLLPRQPQRWDEEFLWRGTRDPSVWLAIPAAIELLESIGLEAFRDRTQKLARRGADMVNEMTGYRSPVADSWHASMTLAELPPGDAYELRDKLYFDHRVVAQIVPLPDRRVLRISCHLYNDEQDLERLCVALHACLAK